MRHPREGRTRPLLDALDFGGYAGRLWFVLVIASIEVRVLLVPKGPGGLPGEQLGGIDEEHALVLIRDDLTESVARATFFHELAHWVVFAFGIHLPGGQDADEDAMHFCSFRRCLRTPRILRPHKGLAHE